MIFVLLFIQSVLSATLSGEAIITSNFLWRGTTFTENKPAAQAELNYILPHQHALGIFVSNAEFSDPAMGNATSVNHEFDLFFNKSITYQDLNIDFNYSIFTFGHAHFFNTDEWNLKFYYQKFMLELSYMDDYFGYQSTYTYFRLGHEITLSAQEAINIFWGYSHFSNRKGSLVSRCLTDSCSEQAYSLRGAGTSHYYDWYFAYNRQLSPELKIELAYNLTNRFEYVYDGSEVSKEDAMDDTFLMTLTHEF